MLRLYFENCLKRCIFGEKIYFMVAAQKKLSSVQLEFLKVFSFDSSDVQLLEIKQLLSNYFANIASNRMDELWEEKDWTAETMK